MKGVLRELRISARIIARNRLQNIVVVLTLGLAISALTSVFSVVSAVMLKPYGALETDRWVYLWEQRLNDRDARLISVSVPNFVDWKRQTSAIFSDFVLWLPWSFTASGAETARPEQIRAAVASPEMFSAADAPPAAGRFLLPSDSTSGEHVVVLSYAFWQRALGGNPSIIGARIRLNLVPHTVVGIAPPRFCFPPENQIDAWTPLPSVVLASQDRSERGYRAAARLRPGISREAAQSALGVVARRLAREYPEDKNYGVAAVPMREAVAGDFRTPLLALSGAIAFALLLVCLNIACLRAVHLESRRKEMLVRLALGARRAALIRQLLMETSLLFAAGGLLGVFFAPVLTRSLLALVPPKEIPWLRVENDPLIIIAVFAATLVTAILAGLLPALRASHAEPARALGSGGTVTSSSALGSRLRNCVLAAQIALTLIPLCGAGLLIRSFERLEQVAPGFDPRERLSMMLYVPRTRYPAIRDIAALADRIRTEAGHVAGVRDSGLVQALPFATGARWLQAFTRTDPAAITRISEVPLVRYSVATAGYFEAMGIALKAGRTLRDSDTRDSEPVVVINEQLARDYFAGENPVGQRIWVDHAEFLRKSRPQTVVGVVANTKLDRLESVADPAAWVPIAQQQHSEQIFRNLFVVIDAATAPMSIVAGVRERIRNIDHDLALSDVSTMEDRVRDSLWRQRFSAIVVGALGVAALGIAVLGVFGITSYLVASRTREIGIRIAVGAAPNAIEASVVRQCVAMAVAGAVAGALGAVPLTRVLSSFLFGVTATDPITFLGVALLLIASAAAASWFPARRAASVDPLTALRGE